MCWSEIKYLTNNMIWGKLLYEHCNVLKRSIPIPIPRIAPQFYIRLWRVILQRLIKILALWYIWRVQWTLIVHRLGSLVVLDSMSNFLIDPFVRPCNRASSSYSSSSLLLLVSENQLDIWFKNLFTSGPLIPLTSDTSIDCALRSIGYYIY